MHSRAETSAETEYGVCGFLHFRIESVESVWIKFNGVRIYFSMVEQVPDVEQEGFPFGRIKVVVAKCVRETR